MKKKLPQIWLSALTGTLLFLGIKAVTRHAGEVNNLLIKKSKFKDGMWYTDKHIYKYKKELKGKLPNANEEIAFTVLSNIDTVLFSDVCDIIFNKEKRFNEEEFVLAEIKK